MSWSVRWTVAYDLRRPCAKCPFRTDIEPFIRAGRAQEIAEHLDRGEFSCHQTTVDSEDEDGECERVDGPNSQHCAGALIMLEAEGRPSQMMRIAERLKNTDGTRMYDPSKLDMAAPVYQSRDEFIAAHERAEEQPKRRRKAIRIKLPRRRKAAV